MKQPSLQPQPSVIPKVSLASADKGKSPSTSVDSTLRMVPVIMGKSELTDEQGKKIKDRTN